MSVPAPVPGFCAMDKHPSFVEDLTGTGGAAVEAR
jgi:hypothetical protein